MAKLVIQNQGMTGRAHELNVDRTTIGRVDDNTLQSPTLPFPAIIAKCNCTAAKF
jgi:hypothetical protein